MMLQTLQTVLRRRGSEGWLVGGTVRDRQLGRFSPDLDVVVTDDPARVARELAGLLHSPWFPLSTRHGAYRVMGREGHVDVSRMRGRTIEDDLSQRDFTINAMAVPLLSPAVEGLGLGGGLVSGVGIVDPFGGLDDLAARRLVAVSARIFSDDPLRLMRAVRFVHVLGFRMDPGLWTLACSQAGDVVKAAAERVTAELALLLEPPASAEAVQLLDRLGLLRAVLPEATSEAAAALEALDGLLGASEQVGAEWGPRLAERLGVAIDGSLSRPVALRLAALLRSLAPGAAAKVGRRLKLSGAAVSLLEAVSSWFHRIRARGSTPLEGLEAAASSGRASTLFCWETSPWEPEVLLVAAAEVMTASGKAETAAAATRAGGFVPTCADRLLRYWVAREDGLPPAPFDGRLLMTELGLGEGQALGRILQETRLAWEAGEVHDLKGALEVARAAQAALPPARRP